MYRPDRIGPHALMDLETGAYGPADALLQAALTAWPAAPKCIVRQVIPRDRDSNGYILYGTIATGGGIKSLAIGCLLTGDEDGQKNSNYLHTVSGEITILPGGLDWAVARPIMARLDGAPVSTTTIAAPEYDPTTITRYESLPATPSYHPTSGIFTSSIQSCITQGLLNGIASVSDTWAIFVGWHILMENTSGSNKFLQGEASIGCHKWLADIQTGDPVK